MDRLALEAPRIAAAVQRDVPGSDLAALDELTRRLLAGVVAARRPSAAELRRLRGEGAEAARDGEPVQAAIDRYLTAAWVSWGVAVELADRPEERAALTELGGVLLKAGDDIAAALAEGYAAAERSLAARAGATRRGVLDELVSLAPDDPAALARLHRRAAQLGLDPGARYRLILVTGAVEIEDEGPLAESFGRALSRPPSRQPHLAAVRGGELVVVLADPWRSPSLLEEALGMLAPLGRWWAVVTDARPLAALAGAHADAVGALRVVRALDRAGELVPTRSVALERALSAVTELTQTGVEVWLGPLERAGRGELVATLEAYFAAGGSVTRTARALGVAPRTVTYRLTRTARLLGLPALDAETRLRLAAALLARRLLPDPAAARR